MLLALAIATTILLGFAGRNYVPAMTAPEAARPTRPGQIVLGDRQFFSLGQYAAYASPWSSYRDTSVVHGRDFADDITVDPKHFPSKSTIRWAWPYRSPRFSGVWGYISVGFGNYDGGEPKQPVDPRQVDQIKVLSEDVSWDHSGLTNFNLLNEFYLTRSPKGFDDKVIEIGLLLRPHRRQSAESLDARDLGTFVDADDRRWQVMLQGKYCMFVPEEDVHDGHIDMLAMLQYLRRKSVISGAEWFNGLAFGVEPAWGRGSVEVATFRVHYQ